MNWRNLVLSIIFIFSIVFQIHNSLSYNPLHGFDGKGHIEYLEYIKTNHKLPLPHEGWQYYQTPLYYLLAMPAYIVGGIQAVQLQNIVYFLLYIYIVGLLTAKIFPSNKNVSLVTTLALAALPVANYLVPMISNEFLNDLIMAVSLLYMMISPYSLINILLLTLGFYTKYTLLTLGPAYAVALYLGKKNFISRSVLYGSIFAWFICSIIFRNLYFYQTPLAMAESFFPFPPGREARDVKFFVDLSWIPKVDMFQAQHYSFIGGTWNTFWHDGYQTTVPVVSFHKKALGLWLLGFPLTIISILGWVQLKKYKLKVFYVGITYLLTALLAYVLYNFHLPYPSELKSFFMSGLPVIYVLGIASSYTYLPKTQKLMIGLLAIQFLLMISYFWIQPWWHVAK